MGRGQVGAGATYDCYDHHMDRTTLRLIPGEFGEWCPPGLFRHPVMSVVKPDFREQADLGLGFSRCLVGWDLPRGGRALAKSARSSCACRDRPKVSPKSLHNFGGKFLLMGRHNGWGQE
jgi:hypothetical protein